MKTISAGLKTKLQSGQTSLAYLVGFILVNGTTVFMTDHDKDIVFAGFTFRADLGCTVSQVRSVLGTSSQSCTIDTFMLDGGLTSELIETGALDDARVVVQIVDWSDVTLGSIEFFRGFANKITFKDKLTASIDCQPLLSRGQSLANDIFSSNCRADLGDSKCKVNIDALKEVVAVTDISTKQFVVTGDAHADNYWQAGLACFTSGPNEGTSVEIAQSSGGGIILRAILPYPPAVGDSLTLYPGCDKTPSDCINRYANFINFRGEPFAVAPWILTSSSTSLDSSVTSGSAAASAPPFNAILINGYVNDGSGSWVNSIVADFGAAYHVADDLPIDHPFIGPTTPWPGDAVTAASQAGLWIVPMASLPANVAGVTPPNLTIPQVITEATALFNDPSNGSFHRAPLFILPGTSTTIGFLGARYLDATNANDLALRSRPEWADIAKVIGQ